jgi:hypothetical protein
MHALLSEGGRAGWLKPLSLFASGLMKSAHFKDRKRV